MEAGLARTYASRGLWLALAFTLLLRLPFVYQPVQGDDDVYITEAAHAQIEPLHPANTTYVFRGDAVDLRGHTHPPLNAWPLALLIAVFGEVKEVPFHAAYIVFSLIAVWSMWSLGKRFSPHPVWATLLFCAVPAFVINGNSFEPDVPFLAFWMASIALFVSGRMGWAVVAMVLCSLEAYQAVFLVPILLMWRPRDLRRPAKAFALLTPVFVLVGVQVVERLSTGALPARVLTGYFTRYGFQAFAPKLRNALALAIHFCFIVCPILVPGAAILAWRDRRNRDTRFLLAWIALFFVGAVIVFFAGSARYLLPVAAPVVLLASRLRPRWLALGFALQLTLSLGLAIENYDHWSAYRALAPAIARLASGHRIWVDGEWGLRYYLEQAGALPLTHTQPLRPTDVVVSSALGHSVSVTAPETPILQVDVRSGIPLRIIGLNTPSGFSDASAGFWPFGVSNGVIDRVTASVIGERHVTQEFLPVDVPEAREQVVSGIYPDHWMTGTAIVVLKAPAEPRKLKVAFYLPKASPARRVTIKLDGHEIAAETYGEEGAHTLESGLVHPESATATVEISITPTFRAPGDARDLGAVVTSVGFVP
jgi:Dolichyl-phosphate-mannose-protein mannosyltransferase